ncbi:uncharacterized protein LOC131236465 isoform X4 [Magnolia sinica]|uniref:uncharacterized protein LOC131236465 isoform X4 n=1 Tax=Magnolia sinica TaxID=86752 RepID=UPI00265A3BB7|nr:uncharacterized protein LOC131236465 isoform X4 [Magnolia sinica]
MRRSPLADSPEVLRVSDSSPSSAESSFRELDDVFLQTQTRIWLGEVLHTRFDEETTIADLLADGEVLFQVSEVIWKMLQTKRVEIKYSKAYIYEPTASGKGSGRYMPYSNVDSFLKVPDFDVVTYTIVMPTDVVGCIRRSLEQSQCSSSSSIICSKCRHSKGKYRQKNHVVEYAQHFDLSSEESDDAESSYQVFEIQSPASNTSFDNTALSRLFTENSPGGDSMVEENFRTPENKFRQHEDGSSCCQYRAISSTESAKSLNACAVTCVDYRLSSKHSISSPQSCLECRIDPNELDQPLLIDSKETNKGKICNGPILRCQNLSNCLPKLMLSDSYASFSDMQEDFTNVSVVPSRPPPNPSCITKKADSDGSECKFMLEENLNASCSYIPELNYEARPECNEIMGLPAEGGKSSVQHAYPGDVEGTKCCIDLDASKMRADDSILGDTFRGRCIELQALSGLNYHRNSNGNGVLFDTEITDDMVGEYTGADFFGLGSNCRASENGDSDACLLNSISGKAADANDDFTGASAHFPEFQNLEEIDERNCTLEVLVSKDSNNALKAKDCIPSDFPDMDAKENHRNLSLVKIYSLIDKDMSSVNEYESRDVVGCSIPTNRVSSCDTDNQFANMKNEDIDATSLLSTMHQQSYITGIQNHALLDTHSTNTPHKCAAFARTNMDEVVLKHRGLNGADTLRTAYRNQLYDGVLADQSNSRCNGFTLQSEIYEISVERVSNGSDSHGVSAEWLQSHDIYPAHACRRLMETLGDSVVINDGNSTHAVDTFTAISEPGIATRRLLNDSSMSRACSNIETGCEAESMATEKVEVKESKDGSNSTIGRLTQAHMNFFLCYEVENHLQAQDPEARSEVQKMSVRQKESSCHTFGMCKDMQEAAMQVPEEMTMENSLNCCSNNRLEDSVCSKNITQEKIDDEKSSTESEEDRYKGFPNAGDQCVPQVNPLGISVGGTGEECVLKEKEEMISHPCLFSPPNDLFCIAGMDQDRSLLVKRNDRNPLLSSIFDHNDQKQHSRLGAVDNKPMPAGKTQSGGESETERHMWETKVMDFHFDFDEASLGIPPDMSNVDQEMPKKAAFDSGHALKFVFAGDSIHHNNVPSSSSIEIGSLPPPISVNQPCSMPKCLENTSDENQSIGVKEDSRQRLIDGNDMQVHGPTMNYEGDVGATGNMDKEAEENERDLLMVNNSDGRESRPNKKLLLKSVAGGMTLFGALLILLHLRKRRGEEKSGGEKIVEKLKTTAPSKIQKPAQERLPTSNRTTVYSGERLKLKD